jgi:hypothetical protein
MPSKRTGILVFFDEERRRDFLRERIEGGENSFSDALSVKDWDLEKVTIALLSFSAETVDYIAIARRGKKVVTSKSRIEFSGFVDLDRVPIGALEIRLEERLQRYLIRSSRGSGGVLPPATWASLVVALKNERPNLAGEIDRLLALRQFSGLRLIGAEAEILVQEREAIGISLDIFSGSNQLRESVLGEWAPREGTVKNAD